MQATFVRFFLCLVLTLPLLFLKIVGSWGTALSALASVSFATSIGLTIYTEITNCKHYTPNDCTEPTCHYYDCPKVCKTPDVNDKFLRDQRDEMTALLDEMDETQKNGTKRKWVLFGTVLIMMMMVMVIIYW